MNYVALGFVIAAILLYSITFIVSPNSATQGLRESLRIFTDPSIGFIPLIVAAILVAGLVQAIVPRELIAGLLGEEAGLKGIALGVLFGSVTPGGPFVAFPLVGGLYRAGAGVGTVLAYISAWSLLGIVRVPMEIPFIGVKLVAIRIVASLVFPFIIGVIGQTIYNHVA